MQSGRLGDVLEVRARGKEDSRGGGEDLMVLGTHLFDLMRREDEQHAGRFFIPVEEAMSGPGRSQQRIAGADRDPLAAEHRVEPTRLDNDSYFGVRIDRSWDPGVWRDGHLLDVERLAPLAGADQQASFQTRGHRRFTEILFIDDWHLHSFHNLPDSDVA